MSEEERAVAARAVEQINTWLLASPLEDDDDMIAVPASCLAEISFALELLIDRDPLPPAPQPDREAMEILRQIASMQGRTDVQTYWFGKARDLIATLSPLSPKQEADHGE